MMMATGALFAVPAIDLPNPPLPNCPLRKLFAPGGKAREYRDVSPPRNEIGSGSAMTPRKAPFDPVPMADAPGEVARLRAENDGLRARIAELEILADRDPLTTILNRRAFMRELHRVVAYCHRYRATASVVFFDMDDFKSINDRFGHAGGDAALQAVAATLATHVRESDLVGRLGGDEFAIILAQADRNAATVKATSLKSLIEAEPAAHDGRAIPLRLTFGVRQFEPGVSAADLLSGADAAMYLGKTGRI